MVIHHSRSQFRGILLNTEHSDIISMVKEIISYIISFEQPVKENKIIFTPEDFRNRISGIILFHTGVQSNGNTFEMLETVVETFKEEFEIFNFRISNTGEFFYKSYVVV